MIEYTGTVKSPTDLPGLYEVLGWAEYLKVSPEQLDAAMQGSWRVMYAYSGDVLVGTARVISDGVVNAYLCGVGVHPGHRGAGIGRELVRRLVDNCQKHRLHLQLMCEDHLVSLYEKMGFVTFAQGMKAEYPATQ